MTDYKFEDTAIDICGTTLDKLMTKGKTDEKSTFARYICYMYLYRNTTLTESKIAKRYNRSNHSTVSSGLKVAGELLYIKDLVFTKYVTEFNNRITDINKIIGIQATNFNLVSEHGLNDRDVDAIKFMINNEIAKRDIAVFYDVTIAKINSISKDNSLTHYKKLKNSEARQILWLKSRGMRNVDIALKLDKSPPLIRYVYDKHKKKNYDNK